MHKFKKILFTFLTLFPLSNALASQISVSTFSSPVNREIADRFLSVQREFDRGNYSGGMDILREILSLKELSGIKNLPLFSSVLLHRLNNKDAKESLTVRRAIADLAVRLSPDMPQPRFKTAELAFQTEDFDLTKGVESFVEGVKRTALFLPVTSAIIRGVSFYVIVGYSIFSLIFSILMVLKYFKPISHQLRDIVSFITGFQAALFLILILLAPVVANLGAILIAVTFLLVSVLFQRGREQFITIALLISGFAVFVCGKTLSMASRCEYNIGKSLYECLHADCSDFYQNKLIANQTDPLASEVLGLYFARRAHLDLKNRELAEKYLQYRLTFQNKPKVIHRVHLNLAFNELVSALLDCSFEPLSGNVNGGAGTMKGIRGDARVSEETRKRLEAVIGKFEKLENEGLDSGYTNFGKGFSSRMLGRTDLMSKEFAVAMGKGDRRLERLIEDQGKLKTESLCGDRTGLFNTVIPWVFPSEMEIFSGSSALSIFDFIFGGSSYPFKRFLLGSLEDMALPFVSFFSIIICLILIFVKKRVKLSEYCVRCGSFSCPLCNLKSYGIESCFNCMKRDSLDLYRDPIKDWKSARRTERLRSFKRFLHASFSLFLPGAGQMMLDRTFKGAFLLTMATFAIVVLLQPGAIFSHAFGIISKEGSFPPVGTVIFAAVYLFSLVDIIFTARRS